MANLFLDLPVPAGDGVGAAVDTSQLGREKTFTLQGTFSGVLYVEFSNEGAGGPWTELLAFNGDGRVTKQTTQVAARFMRIRREGTNPVIGGVPNVDVAANDNGGMFADLPAGAPGASVDVSAFGGFKTVTVDGIGVNQVVFIEISEDGVDWVQCLTFAQDGSKSKFVSARFMRIVGFANADVGAINDATAGMSLGVSSECLIYHPGSGLLGPTIFDDWDDLMVELGNRRMENNGGGCFLVGIDDTTVSPAVVPAGGPYDFSNTTLTSAKPGGLPATCELASGAVFSNLRKIVGSFFTVRTAAVAPTPSPIADFAPGDFFLLDGATLISTTAGTGIPILDFTSAGPGTLVAVAQNRASLGLFGSPVVALAVGQTLLLQGDNGGAQADSIAGPAGSTLSVTGVDLIFGDQSGTFSGTLAIAVTTAGPVGNVTPFPPATAAIAPFALFGNKDVNRFDVSGGGFTQTLPILPQSGGFRLDAKRIVIKEESNSPGLLVAPAGANTIEGAGASVAVPPGGSITFLSDGFSNWYIESVSNGTETSADDTATLFWGNASVSAAADTRFLNPGSDGVASLSDDKQIPITRPGTLRRLAVRHNLAGGNGNSVDYELLINGAATGITVSVPTGAVGQVLDIVNTAAVAAGDRVSLQAVKAAGIGGGTIGVQASAEILF